MRVYAGDAVTLMLVWILVVASFCVGYNVGKHQSMKSQDVESQR
jgi:hypothetical protein